MRTELFPQYLETFNLFGGEAQLLHSLGLCFNQTDSAVCLIFFALSVRGSFRDGFCHLPQPDRSIQDHATDGQRRSFWLRKMTV